MTVDSDSFLAMDFGTANTYVSRCAGDHPDPTRIDFDGDGRDGLATAILFREKKNPLIGHEAIEEFGDATDDERKSYKLLLNFKPDIARAPESRDAAIRFLQALLKTCKAGKLNVDPKSQQVIVGIPADASNEYQCALREVAAEAGYGQVKLMAEPIGALFYHLHKDQLACRDALGGVLVVDFGGGTCDFAFVRRASVQHCWGDMDLGGRLFDDLFFGWFTEQNPRALGRLVQDGKEFFARTWLCREVKEHFSRTMVRDRGEVIDKALQSYGRINELTWGKFVQRAKSYRPTRSLRDYWAQVQMAVPDAFISDEPVDLLEWFRRSLRSGLTPNGRVAKQDINHVILAGGSSAWPFVSDIVLEELGKDVSITRSDRPYVVVAEGLAMMPALGHQYSEVARHLKTERRKLQSWLRQRTETAILNTARETAETVVQRLYIERMDGRISDSDASLAGLKKRVRAELEVFVPDLRALFRDHCARVAAGIPADCDRLVEESLRDKKAGLFSSGDQLVDDPGLQEMTRSFDSKHSLHDPADTLDLIYWLLVAIAATSTSILCLLLLKRLHHAVGFVFVAAAMLVFGLAIFGGWWVERHAWPSGIFGWIPKLRIITRWWARWKLIRKIKAHSASLIQMSEKHLDQQLDDHVDHLERLALACQREITPDIGRS